MANIKPESHRTNGTRQSGDPRRADGLTDKEIGVPAADFVNGTESSDHTANQNRSKPENRN